MCVSKIGLSKVGEAVEDQDVAEVEGGVDLHQLENDKNVDKSSLPKIFKPGRGCVRRRAASSKPFVEAGRQMFAGMVTCAELASTSFQRKFLTMYVGQGDLCTS